MKKIFFFIFLFLVIEEVNAKTYYSNYGEYTDYTEKLVISDDLTYVESIDKYQLYKEIVTYEFLENYEGEETGNIKKVETDWVDDYNLIDSNKNVEECYKYESINIKEFNYLLIDNQSEFNVIIKKFKLTSLDGETILERSDIKLFDFSVYHIELINYGYKFDEIKLEIVIEKEDANQQGEISIGYYLNIIKDHTNLEYRFRNVSIDSNSLEDKIEDFSIYTKYTKTCYDEIPSSGRNYKTYYRNNYMLKEYKVVNREYIDVYDTEDIDGYFIDNEIVKKYYRYKTRDKVEIKDELLIDNYDVKLTDFIINTTIPLEEIKIVSNVDYSKNGEYAIKFILPFKTIEKNVKVNIEQNLINTINKQTEYIKELKENNEISNYIVDKKNLEIKELVVEEENKINETLKELDSCYKNLSNLKNKKQSFKVETKEKNYKQVYVLILITSIIVLVIIRKNIRKKII